MRNNDLMKYAGMAAQFMATLGVAFFIGIWLDRKISIRFPIFTITLPLIMLVVSLWKIVKDSNTKK